MHITKYLWAGLVVVSVACGGEDEETSTPLAPQCVDTGARCDLASPCCPGLSCINGGCVESQSTTSLAPSTAEEVTGEVGSETAIAGMQVMPPIRSMTGTDEAEQPMADNQNAAQPSNSDNGDSMVPMDLGTSMSLPPDPNVNRGWIGGPCSSDDECTYAEAFCLREDEGYPRGLCSQGCDRFCPDMDGMPVTFCIDGLISGQGACVQRCDTVAFPDTQGCRPGYRCETRERYSEPSVGFGVCVPGTPDPTLPAPVGETRCYERLGALGLEFTPSAPVADTPDGGTPGACSIPDPLRLSSPVGGINYCYDAGDQPGENCQNGAMFMACALAEKIQGLSRVLAEFNVVEVGHIGTYNCRAIRSGGVVSQHGLGRALDLRWFRTSDGGFYDIETHWEYQAVNSGWTGADLARTRNDFDTEEGFFLYQLTLAIHRSNLFGYVLTPHFDASHYNHLHIDLAVPNSSIIITGPRCDHH